jgi:predicted transcriptional regulator
VVQSAIAQFVDRTLQGSVSPFVAYLSQRAQVSDDELAELEALVEQLQSRRQEG